MKLAADVQVTIVFSNESEFLTKVENVQSKLEALEKNTYKVQIDFGDSITQAKDLAEALKQIKQNGGARSTGDMLNLRSMKSQVKEYESYLEKLQKKINDIALTGVDVKAVSAPMSELTQGIKDFWSATTKSGKVTAFEDASKALGECRTALVGLSQSKDAIGQIDKAFKALGTDLGNVKKSSDSASVQPLIDKFNTLKKQWDEIRQSLTEGKIQVDDSQVTEIMGKITQLKSEISDKSTELKVNFDSKAATQEVDAIEKKLEGTEAKITSLVKSMGAQFGQLGTVGLTNALDEVRTAIGNFRKDGSESTLEAVKTAWNNLNSELTRTQSTSSVIKSLSSQLSSLGNKIKTLGTKAGSTSALSSLSREFESVSKDCNTFFKNIAAGRIDINTEAGRAQLQSLQSKLSDVSATYEKTASQINSGTSIINGALAKLKSGFSSDSFGSALTMAFGLSWTRVIQKAKQTISEMIQNVKEIDSAMAQLQIVTGATDTQMSTFFKESAAAARDFGSSITDMLGSIETFSRLGLIA